MTPDWLKYANQNATRDLPLSPDLTSALSFLPDMGVSMEVFSGGQPSEGPNRVGSHRHDRGGAADVFFYKDGRRLDWANPEDRPIFEQIVERAKANGVTGFGAGEGYMRPGSMHIGFGKPAVWGAGGRGANAPDWLRAAYNTPADTMPSFDPSAFGAIALDDTPAPSAAAAATQALAQGTPMPQAVSGATPFDPVAAGAVPFDPEQFGAEPVEAPAETPAPAAQPVHDDAGGLFQSLDSFMRGAADVATSGLADEISAGLGAATGIGGTFGDYSGNLEAQRAENRERAQENPVATIAGGLAGALGAGAIAGPRLAATLGGRVAQGAALGAGSGAAYGFGSGEGVENRLKGAVGGAFLGGATGGAVPIATAGIGAGAGAVKNALAPRVNALLRPSVEAERRVGNALATDSRNALAPVLNSTDEASAAINGQNILNVDRGGETTRALMRSAANQDPEARALVDRVTSDRFEGQGPRAQSFIQRIMGGKTDDLAYQDTLTEAARKSNGPAYRKAYEEGSDLIRTPEMERLMGSPAVVKAMKEVASGSGKNRAIAEGMGSFNPGATVTDDGRIIFNKTKPGGSPAFPDLQFWDYVKRELDSMANVAARNGDKEGAATIRTLARSLRSELDSQVSSYKAAREGAASFFGAENALDAGRKFVTQNKTIPETRKALEKMNPAEREAFSVGFASELKDTIMATRDRSNVIDRIFGSEAARSKVRLALGPEKFNEFEQFVRVENAMDKLRGAMGNSTTARQLVELGMAGTAGAGAGFLTGDWKTGVTTALLVRGGRAMGARVDEKMAKRIAELLLSEDPADLQKATQLAAKNPNVQKAIRGMTDVIDSGGSIYGGEAAAEMVAPRKPLEITVGRPAAVSP